MTAALQRHPRYARALRALGVEAEWTPAGTVVTRRVPLLGPVRGMSRGLACDAAGLVGLHLIDAEAATPALPASGFVRVLTPAHVAVLDLAAPDEARRRAMHPKWRAARDSADSRRLRVAAADWSADPGHWLLREEAAQRRARGYRAAPQALALAWADSAPGAARLYVASDPDGPVAGMIALLHPPGATYALGWSGPRGHAASAHHLLLDAMAGDLGRRGLGTLDLGTVDDQAAPGLARFKLRSGARLVALGGSWLRLLPLPLVPLALARLAR